MPSAADLAACRDPATLIRQRDWLTRFTVVHGCMDLWVGVDTAEVRRQVAREAQQGRVLAFELERPQLVRR